MTRSRQTADWGSRAGLAKIVPSSVAVGSGTGSADTTGKVTFSGASTVSLNGVFTSAYRNYRIIVSNLSSSVNNTPMRMRYRISGTDTTSNSYYRYGSYSSSSALTNAYELNTSYYFASLSSTATVPSFLVVELLNPQVATRTLVNYQSYSAETGTYFNCGGFQVDTGSQFDGISFNMDSGNASGEIVVLGYN